MPYTILPPNPRSLSQIQIHSSTPKPPPANQTKHLIATILSLSSNNLLSPAIIAFPHLRRFLSHPFSPHLDHPISSLLASASALRSFSHGSVLHALSLSIGLLPSNPFTVSRIATFYASCGSLDHARAAVEDSTATLAFPWNILISAYLARERWQDAIFSYRMMVDRGIKADKFTNSSVLKACGELRDLELGRQVHFDIDYSDSNCDLFVYNALLAMYAKCGAVDNARKVFDEMSERDVISWNSMVLAYTFQGKWDDCFELLETMRIKGFVLNSVTFNTIICGLIYSNNHSEALILISQARQISPLSSPDSVTLLLALKSCSELHYLKQGKAIHGLTIRSNFNEFENISNALIAFYSKCRNLRYAHIIFQNCSARSVVSWNSMMVASAILNDVKEASLVGQQMIESGRQPSQTTILILLALCADSADLWLGKMLHCYAIRHGFEQYLPIANSVVDMYCKSGRVWVARMVFDGMGGHDRISYTSLLAGYAAQGEGVVVRKLIDEMVSRGIEPDEILIEVIHSVWRHHGIHGGGLCAWNG